MNEIFEEMKIENPLYVATLSNGVTLFVYDGYAKGSDGKIYRWAFEENRSGDCEFLGWRREG